MPSIAFIAYPNCLASSIYLPLEMFHAAHDIHRSKPKTKAASSQGEESLLVYGSSKRIACSGGISLATAAHPREISKPDLIILPAIWRNPLPVVARNRYLLELLKKWHDEGIMLCAVGTGSCFFAEAGLLNQRPATSHWAYFDSFQKHYPQVQLQKNFLITQADKLYCAGSVNAVADLVIYFIEALFDQKTAKRVESNFSPEVRRSYATSIYREGERSRHSDEDIVRLTHWLNENYAEPIDANNMADMLGISVRTLNRRFKKAIQQTPLLYLKHLRHNHARDLLMNSNLSVGDVAVQIGYNDTSHFCREFKRIEAVTPANFRHSVRGKLFS